MLAAGSLPTEDCGRRVCVLTHGLTRRGTQVLSWDVLMDISGGAARAVAHAVHAKLGFCALQHQRSAATAAPRLFEPFATLAKAASDTAAAPGAGGPGDEALHCCYAWQPPQGLPDGQQALPLLAAAWTNERGSLVAVRLLGSGSGAAPPVHPPGGMQQMSPGSKVTSRSACARQTMCLLDRVEHAFTGLHQRGWHIRGRVSKLLSWPVRGGHGGQPGGEACCRTATHFHALPTSRAKHCLQVRDAMLASSSGEGYRRIVVSRLGAMPGEEKQAWKRSLGSLSAGIRSVVVLELAEAPVRCGALACTQADCKHLRLVIRPRCDSCGCATLQSPRIRCWPDACALGVRRL